MFSHRKPSDQEFLYPSPCLFVGKQGRHRKSWPKRNLSILAFPGSTNFLLVGTGLQGLTERT